MQVYTFFRPEADHLESLDEETRKDAQNNFFKKNVIEKYRSCTPTYFLMETQPRIAMLTSDKHLLYWNQIKNHICQLNMLDEKVILPNTIIEEKNFTCD